MARKFIGELILRMQDQFTSKAKSEEKAHDRLDQVARGLRRTMSDYGVSPL